MPKFDLYVGLSGGFGGAKFQGTYEYNTLKEAEEDAYQLAVEEYQSYEGYHGIMSWEDCKQDLIDTYGEDEIDEEDIDLHYTEEVEGWLSYYVKLHDDNNPPEE